jgi:hypothetical protein
MNLSAKREALARIHGRDQRAGRPHKSRIAKGRGAKRFKNSRPNLFGAEERLETVGEQSRHVC